MLTLAAILKQRNIPLLFADFATLWPSTTSRIVEIGSKASSAFARSSAVTVSNLRVVSYLYKEKHSYMTD